MQSFSKGFKLSYVFLLTTLFSSFLAYAPMPEGMIYGMIGNTFIHPNPFGKTPSNPSPIPGFSERDLLTIFVAMGCNDGRFSVQDYAKAITFEDAETIWEYLITKSKAPAITGLHDTYKKLFHPNDTDSSFFAPSTASYGPKTYDKNLFLENLDKALSTMLKDKTKCKEFYNFRNMLALKQKFLRLCKDANRIAILNSQESHAIQPDIDELAKQIQHFEEKLLELNLLNDTTPWDKARKFGRTLIRPATGAYKRLNPLRPNNTKERSNVFHDFLIQKYQALETKIENLKQQLDNADKQTTWNKPTKFAPDFDQNGDLVRYITSSKSGLTKPKTQSLNPFGTISSGPSPIPGVSWRRLAEICRTDKQSFHALDFSSVINWSSFLNFMAWDEQAQRNPESLFAIFLKLYAPSTYNHIFKSNQPEYFKDAHSPVNSAERPKKLFLFISAVIKALNTPHRAHQQYKKRWDITRLEASLLTQLLNLYRTNDELPEFPKVSYKLHNESLPLGTRFDSFNVSIYLNTKNIELKKIIERLRVLDETETKANRMNRHKKWHKGLQASKIIPGIIASPLSVPGKYLAQQTRTAKFSARFKDKQKKALEKINEALGRLMKTEILSHQINYAKLTKAVHSTASPIKADR